jgi:dihydroxyacetone kinase-like predicted kinase
MHVQVADRASRLAAAAGTQRCGLLAVISGDGIAAMYRELGADVLDGGATLNPSTYDILAGVHAVNAEEVVVLPNSRNVVMAAQAAADLARKPVRVVVSAAQQAGLIAALSFDPLRTAAENADAMSDSLTGLRIGQVAPAARADAGGRFDVGEAVGYVGDELVAWGDPTATLRTVLEQLSADAELVTIISGDGAPLDDAAIEDLAPEGVELELATGGQPSRWWLLSAE